LSLPAPSGPPAPAPAAAAPARLLIPSLGIDSAVIAEGVETTGEMALPEDISQVGWYRYSVAPGSAAGSTVLAGHVDSAVQGEGAMFRLRQAEVGAIVSVLSIDGSQRDYRVVARELFGKSSVPLEDLFARDGQPRLTLITCGGQFDAPTRSYESNIVVTAVPVAS
jgi:sortase (surface protein transpeptidase)